jgi:hypothetical protein
MGVRLQMPPGTTLGALTGVNVTYSQLGVAIYDVEAFRSQPGFTEGDFHPAFVLNAAGTTVRLPWLTYPTSMGQEAPKELWLDTNSSLFLVNRLSGELTKVR